MTTKNGFKLKTIHKLTKNNKFKQTKIRALSKIGTNKPNK